MNNRPCFLPNCVLSSSSASLATLTGASEFIISITTILNLLFTSCCPILLAHSFALGIPLRCLLRQLLLLLGCDLTSHFSLTPLALPRKLLSSSDHSSRKHTGSSCVLERKFKRVPTSAEQPSPPTKKKIPIPQFYLLFCGGRREVT